MQARRRRLAAAGAALALAGLTACDRPTPIVTLYSGGTSVYDKAFSYCFAGQDPAKPPGTAGACRYDTPPAGRAAKVLSVRPGDEVTVDVDKDLADAGWFVALRDNKGQDTRSTTQEEHVSSFRPDFSQSPSYGVVVRKLRSAKDDAQPVGIWQFTIVSG